MDREANTVDTMGTDVEESDESLAKKGEACAMLARVMVATMVAFPNGPKQVVEPFFLEQSNHFIPLMK